MTDHPSPPGQENFFHPADRGALLARLAGLGPDAPRAWGRMDAPGMLAHCSMGVEAATGDLVLHRPFLARLIGPLFKGLLLGPKPYSRNSPTHPHLRFPEHGSFEEEKARLVAALGKFVAEGPAAAARRPHGFVGAVTGEQWGRLQWKHLDHHLRQFGG